MQRDIVKDRTWRMWGLREREETMVKLRFLAWTMEWIMNTAKIASYFANLRIISLEMYSTKNQICQD